MDRKGIMVLVVSFILLLMWVPLMNYLYPPKRGPVIQQVTSVPTNSPVLGTNVAELPSVATNPPVPRVQTPPRTAPEEFVVLESDDARYTFTSHGGGLKLVELKQYRTIISRGSKTKASAGFASLNTSAPLPVLALAGDDSIQGDGVFKLTAGTNSMHAEKALTNGLTLIKDFQIRSNYLVSVVTRLENRSTQLLPLPSQEWVVGTATPMGLKDDGSMLGVFWFNGKSAEHVVPGWFANKAMGGCGCGIFGANPRDQYVGGLTNVGWVAVHNQFFALAVMPPTNVFTSQIIVRQIALPPASVTTNALTAPDQSAIGREWLFTEADLQDAAALAFKLRSAPDSLSKFLQAGLSPEAKRLLNEVNAAGAAPDALRQALMADLNKMLQGPSIYHSNRDHFALFPLSEPTRRLIDQGVWGADVVRLNRLVLEEAYPRELRKSPLGYQTSVLYPSTALAANQTQEHRFLLYAGPKEYKTLSRLSSQLQNEIDLVMEYNGPFGFFAKLLLLSMNGIHALGLGYGATIIAITILIKLLFWPLTNLSTRSMKRMAALQPQMKALQEKFKDDPQKMQRKMWEFYKEHKINPASGCLPVAIQMPIFFGFYQMIRTAIELRGASFLWISDLSQPDTLFVIPGLDVPFNLLPLIMGVTMLWQARLTPASPGVDQMNAKLMKYMPLMFLVILYNFSAGLTLYWTVQNLLSIAQMKLTRATDKAGPAAAAMPSPVTPQKKKK